MTRIGIQLGLEHTTAASLRSAWEKVDAMGVDTLWTWDHFFPIHGAPDGPHLECWSVLAAMAATTSQVEIGSLVTCHAFRNPHLLAAMSKTVDQLSGGRLVLGLGAGWFRRDFEDYGYDFSAPAARLRELEETVLTVRKRWADDQPTPVRRIPVLIGSGGTRSGLGVVARHADIWNWFGPSDLFAERGAALDRWCARVGRDPEQIERSVTLYNTAEMDILDDYVAAGADHIVLGLSEPWDWEAADRLVTWARG